MFLLVRYQFIYFFFCSCDEVIEVFISDKLKFSAKVEQEEDTSNVSALTQ